MKALVVGYGSIGARHARILKDLGHEVASVSRRAVDADPLFANLTVALDTWEPQYVVVASRTSEHFSDLSTLIEARFQGQVLVEKPLFDHPARLQPHRFRSIHVAYNLRFHPVVQRLRECVADRRIVAVHAYFGQHLPDWRPGTDYRQSYSASRQHGGGVLRDISHEIDFLTWILGGWGRLTAAGGHFSRLEIDSDDIYSLMFSTERCALVTINMNYLDRVRRREITVLTDDDTLRADLIDGTLKINADMPERIPAEIDETYRAQHRAILSGETGHACSLDEGYEVVNIIAAVELAARERRWVSR